MPNEPVKPSTEVRSLSERLANIISTSSDAGWYVIHAGEERGPLSLADLVEAVAAGEIESDDLVKQTGGIWTKARDIGALQEQFLLKHVRQETLAKLGRFDGIWVSKKVLVAGGIVALLAILLFGSYYLLFKKPPHDDGFPLAAGPRPDAKLPSRDLLFYRYSRLVLIDNFKAPGRGPAKEGVFALIDEGSAWAEKRQFDRAIVKYDQAIRLDPGYHWAFFKRGCAWIGKTDYDKAITDFDEAILLEPDRKQTHFYYVFRGNCYSGKRDYDRAIKEFDDVIRLSPNRSSGEDGLFYRGHAWAAKKDYDKAIRDFDELLQRPIGANRDGDVPPHWFPYIERGIVWSARKDHEKAIKDFDMAIKSLDEWIRFLNDRIPADDELEPRNAKQKDFRIYMLTCC